MSELPNFPFKSQLDEKVIDGIPNINANEDCLPTCLAAGLQYFNHKDYAGEELLHAVYGKTYQGPTAAINYVEYCAKQGVRLYAISGPPSYLLQEIHAHLALGHPVVGTIPSDYAPPHDPMNPGPSHCIVFYKDSPSSLIAMNPWHAFAQAQMDAWWHDRLCFEQIWVLEKKGTTTLDIPQGWRDDGTTLIAPNGKRVMHGFRSWVIAHQWHPQNVPLEEEHAASGGTAQLFRDVELYWSAKTSVQEIPVGPLYLDQMALVEKTKQEAAEEKKALEARIADLEAKLNAPEAAPIHQKLLILDEYIQDLVKQTS